MAEIKLEVSIYPTVYCVVIKDSGLPDGEVVASVWATPLLAEAAAFRKNKAETTGIQWEVATTPVENEMKE